MSGRQIGRLRLRLTAAFAVLTFVVLAVFATVAVLAEGQRRHERLDAHVEQTALAADGYAYPQGNPSRLVVDRQPVGYFGPQRRPGAPVVVVALDGRVIAGPRDSLDAPAARRALAIAQRQQDLHVYDDTAAGEDARLATSPIYGDDGMLATIVAFEPLSEAGVRSAALAIGGAALLLWLLTAAAGWLLVGRALAPAVAVAKREEAFLADAAHELRTPVAVIRARAEQALREEGESGPAAGALRSIEQAAERASGTIADMLELARLDARRGRVEREPLRLDLLLEQVLDDYREQASAAGAELRTRVDGEAVVEGDERLLARSIANLVENAIRYGAVGGEIELSLDHDGDVARIAVADRGPGVPPAQQAAVFDRFHRATAAAGGSGLGLPIARLVAEAHDGTLELAPPQEGRPGARFVLTLPLQASG